MRKFYAFMLLMAMMVPFGASAQTMTEENAVLSEWGYILEKNVDFKGGTVNGVDIDPNNQLNVNGADEGYKCNGYAMKRCTNVGLEFLSRQADLGEINLVNGTGLRTTKNERWIGIHNLRVGQILVFDVSRDDTTAFVVNSIACNSKTGWADTPSDPLIVEPISDGVHGIQELAEEGSSDRLRYFRVISDAAPLFIKFNGKSQNILYGMQIWTSNDEPEAVSAPSISMTHVDGTMRYVSFKSGVSTKGNPVQTFYSLESEKPIYLEDTDEIASADTVWLDDEHIEFELTNIVYKQKLVPVEEGGETFYGDHDIVEGDEYSFDDNDDEDGDGYVIVNAATVSSTGVFSNITTMKIQVNAITLNAPTLSLVGINGVERTYKIGWTNNTLCNEPYTFTATCDGDDHTDLAIGDEVIATQSITVKVEAAGYEDGIYTIDPIEGQNIDMNRVEGAGNNMSAAHNWDFQNFTIEVADKINEKIIDKYVVKDEEGNVIREYTAEQEENEEIPEEDLGLIEPVVKYFGWDGLDSRAAGRHWRHWYQNFQLDEEGNQVLGEDGNPIVESTAYAEDETGLLNGLVADNAHDSYSTMAIFTNGTEDREAGVSTGNNGLFFMSKGTIVVPCKYGEYVLYGSSAGTNVVKCEDGNGNVTLNIGQGTYVYFIDVFTYEELPEAPVGINTVNGASTNNGNVYTIDGRIVRRNAQLNGLQRGMYILNGKKVLVK